MGQKGIAALMVVAVIAAGWAVAHPHRVKAAVPVATAKTESEIRSLDIEFYERRIAEDSFSAADRSRLAALHLQRARETGSYPDYMRAAELARRSIALRESHNAETYVLLTSALLAQHEFTEALRVARGLFEIDTTSSSHAALLAEVELEVGDYPRAERHFKRAAHDADRPSIAARLARWYEVTGRLSQAQALLRTTTAAMARTRDVPREQLAWFHYRLGELELRAGHLASADSAFRSALLALPTDYRALGGLARVAAARSQWQAAVDYGSRAIAVQLDPATLGTMSDAYAAEGDTAQARSFADAMAVAALGQPGSIHRAWGLFLLDHDRDVPRVFAEARKAMAHRRDVYGYDLLAWAAFKAGRLDEARRAVAQALSRGTEDASLSYHAGMIALAAGDSARARTFLGDALALNARFNPTQAPIARRTLDALGGPVTEAVRVGDGGTPGV
jgi:tetratricopeptide (TPR) repeat protein